MHTRFTVACSVAHYTSRAATARRLFRGDGNSARTRSRRAEANYTATTGFDRTRLMRHTGRCFWRAPVVRCVYNVIVVWATLERSNDRLLLLRAIKWSKFSVVMTFRRKNSTRVTHGGRFILLRTDSERSSVDPSVLSFENF